MVNRCKLFLIKFVEWPQHQTKLNYNCIKMFIAYVKHYKKDRVSSILQMISDLFERNKKARMSESVNSVTSSKECGLLSHTQVSDVYINNQ